MFEEVGTILNIGRTPCVPVQLTAKTNATVINYILMLQKSLKILERRNSATFN